MHAAKSQKANSILSHLIKKISLMSTLWRREVFLRTCSEEDLAVKAEKINMTIQINKKVRIDHTTSIQCLFS